MTTKEALLPIKLKLKIVPTGIFTGQFEYKNLQIVLIDNYDNEYPLPLYVDSYSVCGNSGVEDFAGLTFKGRSGKLKDSTAYLRIVVVGFSEELLYYAEDGRVFSVDGISSLSYGDLNNGEHCNFLELEVKAAFFIL